MSRQRAAPDLFEDDAGPGHGLMGLIGGLVAAHPSLAGGSVAFGVIFGFVAANALWHQPGQHPAPILKTREIAAPVDRQTRVAPIPAADGVPARSVTTFRIERSDDTPTASIPVPDIAPASVPVAAAPRPAADPVLARIQAILSDKGLYGGEIDGLMGPKSAAAIRAWEKANGYVESGEASPALLRIMEAAGTSAPARTAAPAAPADAIAARIEQSASPDRQARVETAPTPRPRPAVETAAAANPPVTVPAELTPRAELPVAATDASATGDALASAVVEGPSELVRRIQMGLSNIAYADIAVDGVAGAQTRAAIGAFERHYRLPVTGEPNETVLDKLIEIGAL